MFKRVGTTSYDAMKALMLVGPTFKKQEKPLKKRSGRRMIATKRSMITAQKSKRQTTN
jgi:hypothetical protein